ncbi:MAG: hypothetical protein GY822_21550 [Deltaproteobacteria bacterium]|nr:hypothetical protein [Deltaproteobacteria bacterium]
MKISQGAFFDEHGEAEGDDLVSPANSFGFMDGGIDQVYIQRFGSALQTKVQQESAARKCSKKVQQESAARSTRALLW